MTAIIEVKNLRKVYRTPFARMRVEAVKSVSLTVEKGQTFGFIGPNGAGKTTTLRVLMGLIAATSGEARMFGQPVPHRASRGRIGFLPEAPYFYTYLTVTELVDLAGRLHGLGRRERRKRGDELIELVGLSHARKTPLKKYSKGMLQRAGIAQALVGDPELIVFDEPMSGLDPVGRKDVRDIIIELGQRGKTLFFSSHILADVEAVCDHIAFIARGEVHSTGALTDLIDTTTRGVDVTLYLAEEVTEAQIETLAVESERTRRKGRELSLILPRTANVDQLLAAARALGAKVVSVAPLHETLEDVFIRHTQNAGAAGTASESSEESPA